jgi:hypothetical protein
MPRDRRPKDRDADSFIESGGSAPGKEEDEEIKTFSTRFPKRLVDQIDAAIDEKVVSESRNQWLMKAAVEKLNRGQV